jgi:hypothetical protein
MRMGVNFGYIWIRVFNQAPIYLRPIVPWEFVKISDWSFPTPSLETVRWAGVGLGTIIF